MYDHWIDKTIIKKQNEEFLNQYKKTVVQNALILFKSKISYKKVKKIVKISLISQIKMLKIINRGNFTLFKKMSLIPWTKKMINKWVAEAWKQYILQK